MNNVDKILAERNRTHGHWPSHASVSQRITLAVLEPEQVMPGTRVTGLPLDAVMREGIQMIAHKLGRIAVGDPNIVDHWDDIAGYATLVANHLRDSNPKVAPDVRDPDAPFRAAVERAFGVRASRAAENAPWERDPWTSERLHEGERPGPGGYDDL